MHSQVFSHLDPSSAAAENGGSLLGKRVGVQSLFCVRGWPCEGGSRALRGFVPLEDATVVQRLREAGAILVGNTHSSELGLGIAGDCAGKAVSEGHVDLALMVDTLGEARVAAAGAGLFGFKPSWGRVSRFGLMGLVPSMECCSILARNLQHIEKVFRVVASDDERDPSMVDAGAATWEAEMEPGKTRVTAGFFTELIDMLGPEERSAFSHAVSKLEEKGLAVREVRFEDFDLFSVTHQVIASVEASSSCGKYDGVRFGHRATGAKNWNEMYLDTRRESFGLLLKTFLFQGAYFQFEDYAAFESACRVRARLVHGTGKLFEELDLVLFPTRRNAQDAVRAQSIKDVYRAFSITLQANVTGQPVLSLPGFSQCAGQDPGLQIVGPYLGDERLLSLAQRLTGQAEGAA